MFLKKLYLFKGKIWLRRVENKPCSDVCKFYNPSGNNECIANVCLSMLRKQINSSRLYRYIPMKG